MITIYVCLQYISPLTVAYCSAVAVVGLREPLQLQGVKSFRGRQSCRPAERKGWCVDEADFPRQFAQHRWDPHNCICQ